jgi:exosortase
VGSAAAVRSREASTGLSIWIEAAVLAGLIAALFGEVLRDLAYEWWTLPEASYGMLIPPFACYVAYSKRHALFSIPAGPDLRGLALIALACSIFLTGKMAAEFFLSRISFVVLIAGLVWTVWGLARLRALAFALVLLATMVPPPAIVYNAAAAPLQLFASRIASDLAQWLGVSIYRDGNIIHLAQTSLGVAEACSGLHSLSALIVASLLLGLMENASLLGRVFVFSLSIPLAIAVNVLRVTGTAILADYKPELAMGYYHAFSGWLVFVVGFGLLWLTAKVVFRFTRARA